MPAKSAFSAVDLAHKTCLAAEEQGYTLELMNALAEHPTLFRDMLQVQLGYAEVKILEYLINCDADPFVPEGLQVEEHTKGGQFKWNSTEVEPFLSELQRDGKISGGHDLRKELAGKSVLNANVLDYLLVHKHLIPEEWKDKAVFFWGTIYRYSDGNLYVRYLCWSGGRWHWSCRWLGRGWDADYPAALRASI